MAIPLPGLDRLPSGARREFVEALHRVYDTAGQPSARLVSRRIFRRGNEIESVSHETVSSTLRGTALPSWGKVHAVVTVLVTMTIPQPDLDQTLQELRTLWIAARRPPDEEPVGAVPEQAVEPMIAPKPAPRVPELPPRGVVPSGFVAAPAGRGTVEDHLDIGHSPGRTVHFTGFIHLAAAMIWLR